MLQEKLVFCLDGCSDDVWRCTLCMVNFNKVLSSSDGGLELAGDTPLCEVS